MTINEILKAHGIDDAAITAIVAAMRENRIFTTSEENLDTRYTKLKQQHDGVSKQLEDATAQIAQLTAANAGTEALNQQVADYQQQINALQKKLHKVQVDAAIKVGLVESKAKDVGYVFYKLEEKLKKDGTELELAEDGTIKGWDDHLKGLKTQLPSMFDSGDGKEGYEVFDPAKLKKSEGTHTVTKDELRGMSYDQRMKLKAENPDLYKTVSAQK